MRVLILTAGTGHGHLKVAEALADAITQIDGSEVVTASPLGHAVDACYGWMLTRAPALWGACYAATNSARVSGWGGRLLAFRRGHRLADLVAEVQPEAIVSVHALCTQLAARYVAETGSSLPLYCVVTDLIDVHRSWVAAAVTAYAAPTASAAAALARMGVARRSIAVTGLPLRKGFWTAGIGNRAGSPGGRARAIAAEDAAQRRLRVLVMDGGVPGPRLPQALATLAGTGLPLNIVAAWGSRAPGRRRYEMLGASRCTICHLAMGEPVERAMRNSDVLVTKAGSITLAEALAMARPVVIHRVVPGQEEGNPGYVEGIGAGLAAPTPKALRQAVAFLHDTPEARAGMGGAALAAARPAAALEVARLITHAEHRLDERPA